MNVDDLINIFKEENNNSLLKTKYKKIFFNLRNKSLIITINDIDYIVFEKNIKINIFNNKNENLYNTFIRTNLELKKYLDSNKIDINKIIISDNNSSLSAQINILDNFIQNDCVNLILIENKYPNIIFNQKCLDINKNYYPEAYSQYFNEYFPAQKKNGQSEILEYKNSDERKKIYKNIIFMTGIESIKRYKITGPFSTGKSMTLFKISKSLRNIIYINLKTINKYIKDKFKCLEIIFSEFSRVFLKDKEIEVFNKKLELINFEINILNILLEIINVILDINNDHYIILILDQYKSSNIDSDLSFINNLKKSNERKNFKVIICSSINDNEMRDELIQTWYDNRGNPIELNEKTQDYVFYYSKLYIPEASKTLSFLLFNNKLNYSKLFDERNILNSLNKINDKITNKLKNLKNMLTKVKFQIIFSI